jgi:hypothetical protein
MLLSACHALGADTRAFSGEVGTGSPQKMRSLEEKQSEFQFRRNRIRSKPRAKRDLAAAGIVVI